MFTYSYIIRINSTILMFTYSYINHILLISATRYLCFLILLSDLTHFSHNHFIIFNFTHFTHKYNMIIRLHVLPARYRVKCPTILMHNFKMTNKFYKLIFYKNYYSCSQKYFSLYI